MLLADLQPMVKRRLPAMLHLMLVRSAGRPAAALAATSTPLPALLLTGPLSCILLLLLKIHPWEAWLWVVVHLHRCKAPGNKAAVWC